MRRLADWVVAGLLRVAPWYSPDEVARRERAAAKTIREFDRLIPPQHRRSLKERMRAESLAGGDRVSR